MNVTTTWRGKVLVVSLTGELDTIEQDGLSSALEQVVSANAAAVILDCAGVRYIASLGLSILVKLAKDLRQRRVPLRMAAVTPPIRTILDTVQLGALIPIDPTIEDALGNLVPAPQPAAV